MTTEQRPPRTRAEQVYETLKQQILGGAYEPLQRLVADQIARELQTSVIPVREALNRLESEGLVEIQPYVGARVATISEADVEELLEIRTALEPLLAKSAVSAVTPEALAGLEQLWHEMEAALDAEDFVIYSRKNYLFHDQIYKLSPWRTMYQTVNTMREKFARSRWVFHLAPRQSRESQAEHWAMVEALRAGDPEAMYAASRQQKQRALELFRKVMEQRVRGWI